MVRVIVAEKYDLVRCGLHFLVSEVLGEEVVVDDVKTDLELEEALSFNSHAMVLVDVHYLNMAAIVSLQKKFPNSNWVLLFSDFFEEGLSVLATRKGVFSAIQKSDRSAIWREALKEVASGSAYLSKPIQQKIAEHLPIGEYENCILTPSEREILKEVALGKMTKEIAALRNVSVHTIITHRKNIFKKLGVTNVFDATRYAIKTGIITVREYYI